MLVSKNPATEEVLLTVPELSESEWREKVRRGHSAFLSWRETSLEKRVALLRELGKVLEKHKEEYARLITLEIGRPYRESLGEAAGKSVVTLNYYADHAEEFLAPKHIKTEASESYVSYEPLGVILAVMPWNFPLWQVIRFLAPGLLAGNTIVMKHASNVPQCAAMIETMVREAGFPDDVFQYLAVGSSSVEAIISDAHIVAVTLTGSEQAGSAVASVAGRELKKSLLELGGSDPFIVFPDADIETVVKEAVAGRIINNGQACNSPKRFLVHESIALDFTVRIGEAFAKLVVGDPFDEKTDIGPLATNSIRDELAIQVSQSVAQGARLVTGGTIPDRPGYFYEPTVVADVKPGMPLWSEEAFGPVITIISWKDEDEMISIANDTRFGLDVSMWTKDVEHARNLIPRFETGGVFINKLPRSHPHLPFGGVKKSGYGRELSQNGLLEFVNVKTIWIDQA